MGFPRLNLFYVVLRAFGQLRDVHAGIIKRLRVSISPGSGEGKRGRASEGMWRDFQRGLLPRFFAAVVFAVSCISKGAAVCPVVEGVTCSIGCCVSLEPRPYDGVATNPKHPEQWGEAGSYLQFSVIDGASYVEDGTTPAGGSLPGAFSIAQDLYLRGRKLQSALQANQLYPYWALTMYYDMVKFGENTSEPLDISCDDAASQATAYMDLSHIYGLSEDAARALRTMEGGRLNLTTAGLPWRLADGSYLLADHRNAFDLGTLALATLFMREHNRKADELVESVAAGSLTGCQPVDCSEWDEDDIFEAARQWTIAAYQHVSIQEFIPTILGEAPGAVWQRRETDTVNPSIDTFFAAVGSRWMWSAMGPVVRLMDDDWTPLQEYDPLELRHMTDADVKASVLELYGLEPVLRGMIAAPAADVDATITDHVVSFSTAEPVMDIQRARDLGVPGYNDARAAYGLPAATSFADITSDAKAQRLLTELYGSVPNGMDALVGALAEDLATDPVGVSPDTELDPRSLSSGYFEGLDGSDALPPMLSSLSSSEAAAATSAQTMPATGPLLRAALLEQFRRIYVGDVLWHLHNNTLEAVSDTDVSTLIARNPDPDPVTGEAGPAMTALPRAGFRVPAFNVTATDSIVDGGALSVTFKAEAYWMTWSEPTESSISLSFHIVGVNSKGYFGFGLGTGMRDHADILFVAFDTDDAENVTVTATDRYSWANKVPVLDSTLNYSDDAPEITYKYDSAADMWTVTATRLLDTGDADGDKPITTGSIDVIWSFNLAANDRQHGYDDRGAMTIDFYTGDSTDVTSSQKDFFALHGVIMLIAFAGAAPAAMIMARYFKHRKDWLEIHEALGIFVAQSSIPIAAAAIASSTVPRFVTPHGRLGLAMLCLVILQRLLESARRGRPVQVASGYIRMLGIENRGNKIFGDNYGRYHWFNAYFHRWLGRLMVPLGLVQVVLGLNRISPAATADLSVGGIGAESAVSFDVSFFGPIKDYLYWIWLGMVLTVFVRLEFRRIYRKNNAQSAVEERSRLPHFTQEEFDDRVLQGAKWMVVGDLVIDVADYMKVHPGGSKIMKESVGLDVSAFFAGQRSIGQGVFAERVHKHSAAAWAALTPCLVGYLQRHEYFTEDNGPDRTLLGKAGSDTGSSVRSTCSAGSLRRGLGFGPRFVSFEIVKKARMPASSAERPVFLFSLAPKDEAYTADAVRPGFYFKFRAMHRGTMIQRQYTPVASRVLENGRIAYDFFVRLVPGGQMSEFLRDSRAGAAGIGGTGGGSLVGVQGPFLMTELGEASDHIYMLAGGTGVAPMLQMARYHVRAMLAHQATAAAAQAAATGATPVQLEAVDSITMEPAEAQPADAKPADGAKAAASPQADAAAAAAAAAADAVPSAAGTGSSVLPPPAARPESADAAKSKVACPSRSETSHKVASLGWLAAKKASRPPAAIAAAAAALRQEQERQWQNGRSSTGALVSRFEVEAAERRLTAPDGGGAGSAAALAAFRPAKTIELLWQTHSTSEGFCRAELDDLAAASRGAFGFCQYAKADDQDGRSRGGGRRRRRSSSALGGGSSRNSMGRGRRRRSSSKMGPKLPRPSAAAVAGGAAVNSTDGSARQQPPYSGGEESEASARWQAPLVDGMPRLRSRSASPGASDDSDASTSVSLRPAFALPSLPSLPVPDLMREKTKPVSAGSQYIDGVWREAAPAPAVPDRPTEAAPFFTTGGTSSGGGNRSPRKGRRGGGPAAGLEEVKRDPNAADIENGYGVSSCDEQELSAGTGGERSHSDSGNGSAGGGGDVDGADSDAAATQWRRSLVRSLKVGTLDLSSVGKLLAPVLAALDVQMAAQAAAVAEAAAAVAEAGAAELTAAALAGSRDASAGGGAAAAAAPGGAAGSAMNLEATVIVVSGPAEFADGMLAILKELRIPDSLVVCLD